MHIKRLRNASIENKSFEYILKEYDYDETLFYLDPHYVGTKNYYKNMHCFGLNMDMNFVLEIKVKKMRL